MGYGQRPYVLHPKFSSSRSRARAAAVAGSGSGSGTGSGSGSGSISGSGSGSVLHIDCPEQVAEVEQLRHAQQLREATALHDRAVRSEHSDLELALQLYRDALRIRPSQWESSLRMGTLLMGRASRSFEAEAALRYTLNLSTTRTGVDQCAPRTNLGVLLTERVFGRDGGSVLAAAPATASRWAVEALTHFDAAIRAGRCNVARLNAGRLLRYASRGPPLQRGAEPDEFGLLGATRDALLAAAVKQYTAALETALLEDDVETAQTAARNFAQLAPGGAGPSLTARQHAAVGRAAVLEGDIIGGQHHTSAALRLDPKSYAAYHTLGLLAERTGDLEESVVAYRTAVGLASVELQLDADHRTNDRASTLDAMASASNNLGNMLQATARVDEALAYYDVALRLKPGEAETWNNRAVALFATRGRFEESVASYSRALSIRPNFAQAFGGMMYTKTYICDWRDRASDLARLDHYVDQWLNHDGPPVLLPLQSLNYPTGVGRLKDVTQGYARDLRNNRAADDHHETFARSDAGVESSTDISVAGGGAAAVRTHAPKERIRLCYASLGFESHPHGQLMRGVFAHHNRSAVEVVVFALSKDDGSDERSDIRQHADHFVLLEPNHPSPKKEMQSWNCDVLMYLDGYIMRARPELFARAHSSNDTEGRPAAAGTESSIIGQPSRGRPKGGIAKIQVACMYPSTLGSSDFDYHLGDRIVMPPELHDSQFTEELLELPYSYYVNDYARSYAVLPDRSELVEGQLPPPGRFRFANFNQLFKVDGERTLVSWSNLLRRNPSSVLWQLENPQAGVANLRGELAARGVGPDRLYWSSRTSIVHHLARCATMSDAIGANDGGAGLGVDTRQYNAHTTATDLLWGGAVYLTVPGALQAARVAAGLAVAHGVPDLITHSEKEYEDVAAELSARPPDAAVRELGRACYYLRSAGENSTRGNGRARPPCAIGAATLQMLGKTAWQAGGHWRQASTAQFGWLQAAVAAGRQPPSPLFDGEAWVRALEEQLASIWSRQEN